jgi:lipopolysaccharide export system permease protein
MTTFHRHVAGTLLLTSIGVLLAMLALVALFALMDELPDANEAYSFADALLYVGLSLPRRALEILPYAVFLGSLVGLGSLAEHSELTVVRAAGMSPSQMFLGVAAPAVLLMALGAVLGEWVAPAGEERAELFKEQQLQGSDTVSVAGGYWYREGNLFMNVDGLLEGGGVSGARQFFYDENKNLVQTRRAETAVWEEATGSWLLRDVVSTQFPPAPKSLRVLSNPLHAAQDLVGAELRLRASSNTEVIWLGQADPRLLSARLLVDENRLSIADLYYQINYMRREKLSVTTYELAFWTRLQQPFAVLGLALLAMAFVLGPLRQVSIGLRVSAGVLVGLTFKYLQDLFAPMSLVYGLPAFVAVAIPILLCWLVAVIGLRRAA